MQGSPPPNLPHAVGEERTALRAICVSPPNLPHVVGEACSLPLHLWGGPGWGAGSNVNVPDQEPTPQTSRNRVCTDNSCSTLTRPRMPTDPSGTPAVTLYLASASPRRQDLLRQVGVPFALLAPQPEEDSEALEAALPGEMAADYVQRVTRLKLEAARERLTRRHPDQAAASALLLCADTTVTLDGRIYGKPQDATDAARILRTLSGATHEVLTAVCVQRGAVRHAALQTSQVRFAPLSDQDIAAYIATGEPFGKAGAYAMQGLGAAFVEQISGSASGIIGLPLFETLRLLRAAGWPGAPHSQEVKTSSP